MKKLLTLLLSLFLTTAFAQKCKYDVDTKDAFSGKRTLGTTAKLGKEGALIGFNLQDDRFWVGLFIDFFGEKNEAIAQGDSLLLKLITGDIITLYTNEAAAPTSYVAGSGAYAKVMSYYKPNYNIDRATMTKLAENMITDIKFYMGMNSLPIEISSKAAEKVMAAAACIVK